MSKITDFFELVGLIRLAVPIESNKKGFVKAHVHCGDQKQELQFEYQSPTETFQIKCSHCGEILGFYADLKLMYPSTTHKIKSFSRWQNYVDTQLD